MLMPMLRRGIEMVDSVSETGSSEDIIKLQTMLDLARAYLESAGVEGIVEKCLTNLRM